MTRAAAGALWLALVIGGFVLAPPQRPALGAFVVDLLLGRWDAAPPWVVAEFQMMGLWPALTGLLVRGDWRARPVPAWPFVLASFGLGCYALLPWFVVRSGERSVAGAGPFDRVDLPFALAFGGVALTVGAAAAGGVRGPAGFLDTLRGDGFVFAMTLDFVAFWVLSMAEARARTRGTPWQLAAIPLVGLGAFLGLEAIRRRSEDPAIR